MLRWLYGRGVAKVALIFGVMGACRRQELCNLTTKDVENLGDFFLIRINNTRNKTSRTFTISGPFYEIVKKYEALRTTKTKSDRFFQNYQKGKCTSLPIGLNKFGAMPKEIARFLDLPDASSYTGHSFKRTSATLLLDYGRDNSIFKQNGGWCSKTKAGSYVEDSIHSKNAVSNDISTAINFEPPLKKFCSEKGPTTSYVNNVKQADNPAFPETDEAVIAASPETDIPAFSETEEVDIPVSPKTEEADFPAFSETEETHIPASLDTEEVNEFINKNIKNEIITNNFTQSVKMPDKTVVYNFSNCTFINSFNA